MGWLKKAFRFVKPYVVRFLKRKAAEKVNEKIGERKS